uniref:Uncharacterized protein n=1 Tax=Arundo donax TaxID=35708 RepID=A0A0A9AUC8_ARUDO
MLINKTPSADMPYMHKHSTPLSCMLAFPVHVPT